MKFNIGDRVSKLTSRSNSESDKSSSGGLAIIVASLLLIAFLMFVGRNKPAEDEVAAPEVERVTTTTTTTAPEEPRRHAERIGDAVSDILNSGDDEVIETPESRTLVDVVEEIIEDIEIPEVSQTDESEPVEIDALEIAEEIVDKIEEEVGNLPLPEKEAIDGESLIEIPPLNLDDLVTDVLDGATVPDSYENRSEGCVPPGGDRSLLSRCSRSLLVEGSRSSSSLRGSNRVSNVTTTNKNVPQFQSVRTRYFGGKIYVTDVPSGVTAVVDFLP